MRSWTVRACAAAALFALAFSAGALFARWSAYPAVENDAAEYLALARSVAAGSGFSIDGTRPEVYRPPLFSGLLGGWFRLTGTSSLLSAAHFQSLLHALGVVAAFLLFLEVQPSLPRAAALAAFLALNPILVTRVVFVLQETTLLLFTTLAALASVRLLRRPSTPRAALAGAAWGVCALGKIVCWFAPLLLLATRFLPRRLGWRWRRREALALAVLAVLAVAPWTARNYARFGAFIPVNGQGGGILEWKVEHAEIPGEPGGIEVRDAIRSAHPDEAGRTAALWRYVAAHPRYFLVEQVLSSALHYAALPRDWWLLVGGGRPHEHDAGYWLLFGLAYLPFYLALLLRTWQLARGAASPASAFLVPLVWLYWAQYALLWGDPRFNLALYPVLASLALARPLAASARDEDQHLAQAEGAQPPQAGGAVEGTG